MYVARNKNACSIVVSKPGRKSPLWKYRWKW